MLFLSLVIRKVKSFGQGHEAVKCPSWDQTQVWLAPSKACRCTFHCRTGSVLSRGPEQYQRRMCKGILEMSPSDCMWIPQDSSSQWCLPRPSCLHDSETQRQSFLRFCTQGQCLLCSGIYTALKLSVYLGRESKGQLSIKLQKKQFVFGKGAFSTFSVLSPLLSPLHHKGLQATSHHWNFSRAKRKDQ